MDELAKAIADMEQAAREVDAFFDPYNRGDLRREWIFGGKRVSSEASLALLSLHDYLNVVKHHRKLSREGEGT